jgi:hypothetical protein
MTDARTTEARAIRDAALVLLRRIGRPQMTEGKTPVRITLAETEGLRLVHNIPFTPQPAPSGPMRQALAIAGRAPLPYALDIWNGRTKTFSMSWNDDDLQLTTFKKGSWATSLLAAAREAE